MAIKEGEYDENTLAGMFAARLCNDLSCKTEQAESLSSFGYIRGLRALLPLHNLELDYIALLQALVAF